jgi:hypothetical protein
MRIGHAPKMSAAQPIFLWRVLHNTAKFPVLFLVSREFDPETGSHETVNTPVSSSFRHRNTRPIAFTIALSPRRRGGAQVLPSGATMSFRPPRFRNTMGTRAVSVCPSFVAVTGLLMQRSGLQ